MAKRKLSQTPTTATPKSDQPTKQDNPNVKCSKITGDYFLTGTQMDSIRHLVLASQGIYREFNDQDEAMALAELFLGFSSGLSSVMEEIQGQLIGDAVEGAQ